jgi:predicted nucleotidyltransferase
MIFMKTLEEIKAILNRHQPALKKKYPIASLAIFGSYTRGEQTENSDVDILVEFNGPIGLRFFDLAYELEELLGLKVDLVSKEGVKPRYMQVLQNDLEYV